MSAVERFGDHPLIADTTVWAKLSRAPAELQAIFRDASRGGLILGSPIVRMEFLHDAQEGHEFDRRDALFSTLRELGVTREVCDTAVDALRRLRQSGSAGYHRVPLADALIAATAERNAVNVLHDDRHYDRLASVMAFKAVRFGPITP